ncbi:Hypothetical protein SCF082_LOCUS44767 [Durusdinium trenchii]|uniref:Uncharacterized protein n=1 Tax=Durusdinium trenchii TaxID=1381693 RepID=A0ABP0R3X8_9DINO
MSEQLRKLVGSKRDHPPWKEIRFRCSFHNTIYDVLKARGFRETEMDDNSEGDVLSPDAMATATAPFFALEAGEIENRLRKHTIELTEPAIARTAAFERKLHEVRLYTDLNAENLKQLHQKLSAQENLKLTVESFRGQLFEWDKERRDHQELMNEKVCLQEDEIGALYGKMELQTVRTEACNRGLKHLGDLLTETREELAELRSYCSERIDINREKIVRLREELETKHSAIEVSQFKLNDDVTNMTTAFQHVSSEVERIGINTEKAVADVAELCRVKARIAGVEEQQETYSEFSRSLTDAVGSLKMQLDTMLTDVQEHVENVKEQEDSLQIGLTGVQQYFGEKIVQIEDIINAKKKPDLKQEEFFLEVQQLRRDCKEIRQQMQRHERARGLERDAMQAIVESQQIAAQIDYHEDQDRQEISLFGCKPVDRGDRSEQLLPSISKDTPRKRETASLISLDKRCLSCCGGAGAVLAGFKIACLNYTAGPVEYRQTMYSRAELLHLQSKLVDQASDRMARAANV